jgi:hypothetical protein
MQRRRCRQLPKAAPAPPQLVRSSRRLPGRRRRRGGRSTEEEIQSSGSANQIGGIRGLRAALSRRRHQASRTAKLRRSAPRPEMGKPPPRQRGGPFGFVYLYIIVGVVISIIAFGLCRSGLVYSRFLVNYYFFSELASDGARREKFCIDLMVGICFPVCVCVVELVSRNLLGKD